MISDSDYSLANLRPEMLRKIQELETELSHALNEPIVLLAYEEKGEPHDLDG